MRLLLLLAACVAIASAAYTEVKQAVTYVQGSGVSGFVNMYYYTNTTGSITKNGYRIEIASGWYGFVPGQAYGMHMLLNADLHQTTVAGNGGVFNPRGNAPGCDGDPSRRDGDLSSYFVFNATDRAVSIFPNFPLHFQDSYSAIGRMLVITDSDSGCPTPSDPTTIYAQGVIGMALNYNTGFNRNTTYDQVLQVDLLRTFAGQPNSISGKLQFVLPVNQTIVQVYGKITGLMAGNNYGLHVHTYGDLTDLNAGTSAGGHYNPAGQSHATPTEQPGTQRHQGDMGSVIAQADGTVYIRTSFNLLTTRPPSPTNNQNILGRCVVLHALPDQGAVADPTGNAGARLAFGVIGMTALSALDAPDVPPIASAVARLYGTTQAPTAAGNMRFVAIPQISKTNVTFWLTGLPPSTTVSIHIRNWGDTTIADGTTGAVGTHFNPMGWPHACYPSAYRHPGDFGNFITSPTGAIQTTMYVDLLTLIGQNSVIGRSITVYSVADNCVTEPTGGFVLAQGVIGIEFAGTITANTAHTYADNTPAPAMIYTASLAPTTSGNSGMTGNVWIMADQEASQHYIYARISGLVPRSVHGLHIHQFGDLTTDTGSDAGGHLEFGSNAHSLPSENLPRHMGDMGNAVADADGGIRFYIRLPGFVFNGTTQNIAGRAIVLHAAADQGSGFQPTGNSGARVMHGVLGISGRTTFPTPELAGPKAYAGGYLRPLSGRTETGTVRFTQGLIGGISNRTLVQYSLSGLTAGATYGLHIRTNGDISSADASAQGVVYDPLARGGAAGCAPGAAAMGRLGNVVADGTGSAVGSFNAFTIDAYGDYSIIGRGLTISVGADDCSSAVPPGTIVAQAVLGLYRPVDSAYGNAGAQAVATGSTRLRATVMSTTNNHVNGTVWFRPSSLYANRVEVYARFYGCVPGKLYGFHVHQYGDWSTLDGDTAGPHWNPTPATSTHALPDETFVQRLAGEMGNTMCTANGEIYFNRHFDLMTVGGAANIIGRGMILHYAVDQGAAQPALNNFRVALGVIGQTTAAWPTAYDTAPQSSAIVVMRGTSNNPGASGIVRLIQQPYNATMLVTYDFTGLLGSNDGSRPYQHSIHVHEFGDMTDLAGGAAGFHFNPYGWSHQCYPRGRHVGDIGNFVTDTQGNAQGYMIVDLLTLFGSSSVVGRAIIVHQRWDDCSVSIDPDTGLPAPAPSDCGNCGVRFMQGVIGFESSSTTATNYDGLPVPPTGAVAYITGNDGADGQVNIYPKADGSALRVRVHIKGFTSGSKTIQIRTNADVSSVDTAAFVGAVWKELGTVDATGGEGTAFFEFANTDLEFNKLVGRSIAVMSGTNVQGLGAIGLAANAPADDNGQLSAAFSVSSPSVLFVTAFVLAVAALAARF